jgi:hypothetical protein
MLLNAVGELASLGADDSVQPDNLNAARDAHTVYTRHLGVRLGGTWVGRSRVSPAATGIDSDQ